MISHINGTSRCDQLLRWTVTLSRCWRSRDRLSELPSWPAGKTPRYLSLSVMAFKSLRREKWFLAAVARDSLSCLQGVLQKASGHFLSLGTSSSFCRACKELADPADIFFPTNIVYLHMSPLRPLTADTSVLRDTLLFCWVGHLSFRCFMFDSSIGSGKVSICACFAFCDMFKTNSSRVSRFQLGESSFIGQVFLQPC